MLYIVNEDLQYNIQKLEKKKTEIIRYTSESSNGVLAHMCGTLAKMSAELEALAVKVETLTEIKKWLLHNEQK